MESVKPFLQYKSVFGVKSLFQIPNMMKRNWVFVTCSYFLILISLQHNVLNLWCFKLLNLLDKITLGCKEKTQFLSRFCFLSASEYFCHILISHSKSVRNSTWDLIYLNVLKTKSNKKCKIVKTENFQLMGENGF